MIKIVRILLLLALPAMTVHAQCIFDLPPNGTGICLQGVLSISNTSSSFTISNPTTNPVPGSYTLKLGYFSRTTGVCGTAINCATATVSTAGSGFTVDLAGCANLPANFSTAPVIRFNLVSNTGGPNYFLFYKNNDCGLPLPIVIDNFNLDPLGGTIKLKWNTLLEQNASHFIIERNSVAGSGLFDMEVGRVNATNLPNGSYYEWIDQYPLNGHNFYRLKMVDLDGTFEYSPNYVWNNCQGCNVPPPQVNCNGISINGPSLICSGSADFSVSSPLYYNKYTWSLDNHGSLSTYNGPSTTVSQWGIGNGLLQLHMSRCTPATATKGRGIEFGSPVTGYYYPQWPGGMTPLVRDMSGTNYVQPGINYVVIEYPSADCNFNLLWGNLNSWRKVDWRTLEFNMPVYGDCTFQVELNGPCGFTTEMFTFQQSDFFSVYSVSPNPASSQLRIAVDDKKLSLRKIPSSPDHVIRQIIVLDKTGVPVLRQQFAANTKTVSLNVASLKMDVYTVRIFNGKTWTTTKFIKQ
jgi:hypothetical protein